MTKRLIGAALAALTLIAVAMVFPRGAAAVASENSITAGGAGVFPGGASFNTVQLAGGTFGIGAKTYNDGSAVGDVETQFNGSSLIGLEQDITVTGWVTAGTLNPDSSVTLNGTATPDMGDGTPPSTGVPLVVVVSASGVQVTVGGSALPTLPKSDGFINIE